MSTNKIWRVLTVPFTLVILFSMFSTAVMAAPFAAPANPVSFTILHTNDFHGQLESSGSNPGMARVATIVNEVRTSVGASNVLLVDAGDEMQGSLLSNLGDGTPTGKGIPTIATYNAMDYKVATFGNHEFDWGQVNLGNRTTEATYPYVTANIVKMDGADCASSGWTKPDFADAPYQIITIGTDPDTVKVAFIGVTTTETPTITVSTATAGICFKDPADSIIHYYDQMKADGADVIVVLSHLGYADGGYGYGLPVYGDQTLATKLNTAGKPVNLIIGGHSHTNLTAATTVGTTKIAQAYYNGRRVGRADVVVGTDGSVSITWASLTVYPSTSVTPPPTAEDPTIKAVIDTFATDLDYLALVNTPIGYSAVDLPRSNTGDNMMGTFIDDAIYDYLNTDAEPANDVDLFFNNAGGIRTDWCYVGGVWANTGCVAGVHDPALLTYGNMFTILPFGNATVVGDMTGEQIMEVVNYGPNVAGVIQPAGLEYKYYSYKDANPGPQPFAWGAYDICVTDKVSGLCEPLDMKKTYRVGTNEFLAPAGGDGYGGFKYMTNITYWGDMLNAVNAYVTATYGTSGTAYMGPNGDGTLDGRIVRNGTDVLGSGDIIPVTVLHHNDMHGNLYKGTYVGYTQLATLIKQEKLHNPTRTLLLNSGDDIQGDALAFYYKSSYTGKAVDGTDLDPSLWTNPVMAVMNSMSYDAMTLGNHEYNFGSGVFKGVLGQATFPILQANVAEDSLNPYGLADVGVQPYVEKTLGTENINIAILGIGNHRIPNYELPSNIPGLTFSNPLTKAQELSTALRSTNDVVLALTHIGFTEDPKSVEVDANVDTNLAATVTGIDAIVGGHSHTNPATGFGNYKFLPTFVVGPDNTTPVIIGHAYRYNNTLGEIVLGMRAKIGGGYEVVTRSGRYLSVATSTVEDAATKAIVDPYLVPFNAYNTTVIGDTNTPIDALQAFTQETSGANLQADAAVEALRKTNTVDFHLSGAMTNKAVAAGATPSSPVTLKVSDMFTVMPYENSLVVLSMNGPELKAVLERAYRNYYYYKYVPGYGGYSYYTTCMLDINSGGTITYNDLNPALPNGNNVVSLEFDKEGVPTTVDFTDAVTHYNVSTVNYLAAGSCNFNNSGVTLWPLGSIVADTQLYVRDVVIDYIKANTPVAPAVEGRLQFIIPPTVTTLPADPTPTSASNVNFTVTFSEAVTGVDMNDFSLNKTGTLSGEVITGITGGPTIYTVSVNTGIGNGNLRLDLPATATIADLDLNPLYGLPYTSGTPYTVNKSIISLPSPWIGGVSISSNKNVVAVGRPHIGAEVASYDGFSAGALTAYVPMLFKNAYGGSYDSAFYIQNVDSTLATISIKYYNSTGALTCTVPDTIAPLASKGYWLPGLAATCLPDDWVGSAVVTSDKNIVANGRPHINGEVMTYDSFSSGSLTSYLPMLFKNAYGGSYDSAFYVQNVHSTNTANLTIKYYDSAGALTCTVIGETVAPFASKGYWLPGLAASCLPDGWIGSVEVTSDTPIVTIGRPHIGTQITTYNGFAAGAGSSYVPMLFKNAYGGSYDAAFYVQNVDATTATISIKYYALDGTLTCTVPDSVAPLASKGYWLPGLPTSCLPDGWVGGVVVTSDADVVAIGRPHIGAQVMTYNGFTGGSLNSYLPMLFKDAYGGSYDSAFYIQNTEAAAATVTTNFYDSTGALACSRNDTIPALSTLGIWVPSTTCSP